MSNYVCEYACLWVRVRASVCGSGLGKGGGAPAHAFRVAGDPKRGSSGSKDTIKFHNKLSYSQTDFRMVEIKFNNFCTFGYDFPNMHINFLIFGNDAH